MSTILDSIVADTRLRVNFERTVRPIDEVMEGSRIRPRRTGFPFERVLASEGMSLICEVKKASPSKGVISEDFPYMDIAREYASAGASAISVLTEPRYFRGEDRFLEEIADSVDTPVLRKDFVIDEYQIYRAREIGASAVLLIASILNVSSGAGIIGVNNRDLATFDVDLGNSLRLRERIPEGIVCVSESGISGAEDVRLLRDAGFDAVLVGEAFMRSPDRRALMEAMRS